MTPMIKKKTNFDASKSHDVVVLYLNGVFQVAKWHLGGIINAVRWYLGDRRSIQLRIWV